jgi:DNA-binding NarL/FixJ family response regulator
MRLSTSHRRAKQRLDLMNNAWMTPMKRNRLVVADDLATVLGEVTALLRESFEVVGMFSDGRAALEGVIALEPDLVVLDISMPEMSGIEVAEELTRRAQKTRIVFLTVHEDMDILKTCQAAGGLGYVIKLHMNSDLVPAINEALAGRTFTSRFQKQQGAQQPKRA